MGIILVYIAIGSAAVCKRVSSRSLPMHKQALLDRLEFLFVRLSSATAEDELSFERPLERNIPAALHLLVDDRVVLNSYVSNCRRLWPKIHRKRLTC